MSDDLVSIYEVIAPHFPLHLNLHIISYLTLAMGPTPKSKLLVSD
jgi:hypothetical protein